MSVVDNLHHLTSYIFGQKLGALGFQNLSRAGFTSHFQKVREVRQFLISFS